MSDSFERLLRSTRRDAAPADACPDAEALAAYLDGGLSRAERDTVERHASQCERCALTMAAVVRLEDAAGTPARPAVETGHWWRRWAWAVPAATAVLVAVIWTALPRHLYEDNPERTLAVGDAPASPAAPEPSGASAPATVAPSDRVEEGPASPSLADADNAAPKGGPRAAAPQATVPGASVERQQGVPLHDTAETRAFAAPQAAADAARESAAPPAAAAAAAGQTTAATSNSAGAAGATRDENAGGAPLAAEKAAPAPPAPSAPSAPPQVAPAPASRASAAPESLIVWSPARRSAWRTVGGRIERSVDGGTTWTADGDITSSRRVLAGAAMSEDVCWLVGEHGLVWRRTSEGWRQAESPTTDPLIQVAARSAAEATVVTGAGIRFTTRDGGATWR